MASQTTLINQVRALCAKRKLRFTETRRKVLTRLIKEKTPCKAYTLLQHMTATQTQPTSVYRALDFLLQHGFAHKIHSQNGYVACLHPQRAHDCHFLICRHCRAVEECCSPTAARAIDGIVKKNAFQKPQAVLEIYGICKKCHRH